MTTLEDTRRIWAKRQKPMNAAHLKTRMEEAITAVTRLHITAKKFNEKHNPNAKGPCDSLVTCANFIDEIEREIHTLVTTG